jgi:hypothetical protein
MSAVTSGVRGIVPALLRELQHPVRDVETDT